MNHYEISISDVNVNQVSVYFRIACNKNTTVLVCEGNSSGYYLLGQQDNTRRIPTVVHLYIAET